MDSRLPVTAKAFLQDGVIGINPRAFARGREEDRWGRWVAAVAHEWHHLVLWHAGPGSALSAGDSPADPLVFWTNVLIEGVGTHLALQTGLFPDVQSQVEDRRLLEKHFRAVRRHWPRLSASRRDAQDPLTVLFWKDKSAYWVGCWMARSIEAHFGRVCLLELLDRPGAEAAREFVKLYNETQPPANLKVAWSGHDYDPKLRTLRPETSREDPFFFACLTSP
ncbi:MAG: hypothetical protein HY652_13435 [Acidobacteria bacterium]|nr:hypothetical protein [Acidobacteriota bacterium]